MESLILCVVQKKYDQFENIITKPDKFKSMDLLRFFSYYVTLAELKLIDDKQTFILTYQLLQRNDFLDKVSSIDTYLTQLRLMPKTQKLLKTATNLHISRKNIQVITRELDKTSGSMRDLFRNINEPNFEILEKIFSENIRIVVNSFHDSIFLNSLRINIHKGDIKWESSTDKELISRLLSMVNIFGESFLNFIDVPLIKITTFLEYSHQQKVEYYIACISKLNFGIRTIERMIRNGKKLISKSENLKKLYQKCLNGDNDNCEDDKISDIVDLYLA
jgi:hypothetical protein